MLPLSFPFPVIKVFQRLKPEVTLYAETAKPFVALTLDDGPHPTLTEHVLTTLDDRNAHATFFLIGCRAKENRSVVEEIAGQRHELGNHTWREECSARLPRAKLEDSVRRTHDLLSELAPMSPVRLLRPGSGFVNRKVLDVASAHRYRCVLGSIYPHDVRVPWTNWIINDILSHIRPGAIIVLHEGADSRQRVVQILDAVLGRLRDEYTVTTVSKLLEEANQVVGDAA